MPAFVILGCGYTGQRVARLLVRQGHRVIATTRDVAALTLDGVDLVHLDVIEPSRHFALPQDARVLHSIPVPATEFLEGASRVVYLSTTGVYGKTLLVDHNTPIAPSTLRELARAHEEQRVSSGPWSSLILRPAAIYGPDRGVHVSMRQGRHRLWGDGSNYISRIHVDDLAAISAAALLSDLTGAYPVADDEPCTALEITQFAASLFGLPIPPSGDLPGEDTRRVNRRVDGSEIRRLFGIKLRYPTYREGLGSSL